MKFEYWYLTFGALLIVAALTASVFKRLPLTTTMFYLGIGAVLGPMFFDLASIDALFDAKLLEHAAEFVVIVSLFTAGLKLRAPFRDGRWSIPVRLASISMILTVGMVTLVGMFGFGLPLGAAVLLGGVLAPTDPVLASDVQLESATDRDKLRFSLTGEAGLNDGTAFPFVMLGLGLLGLHELGDWGSRWFFLDVVWAAAGGLAIGAILGIVLGKTVLLLRREHKAGMGREEFLTLGLIGLSYGTALVAHTYGFLAVFAAGLALRRIERNESEANPEADVRASLRDDPQSHPESEPAHLAASVLNFNEQLERVLEVALVLMLGLMLNTKALRLGDAWIVPVLLLVIRPIAVWIGVLGAGVSRPQFSLISWFGIRGIGSIYYLAYAIEQGVSSEIARQLVSITLWVIATSIVVHGISVTPLMSWYQTTRRRRASKQSDAAGVT